MLRDDAAALGLPVRMVVLTIVGMTGLGAMIMFMGDMNLVPGTMHADIIDIDNSNTSSLIYVNSGIKNVTIEVIDAEGVPIEGATVVIFCPDYSAMGLTGTDGKAHIKLDTSFINIRGEGYLKLAARAQGYGNYQNDFAIKMINI